MGRTAGTTVGAMAAGLALVLAACGSGDAAVDAAGDGRELTGVERTPPPDVGAVTLPDATRGGEPFPMAASPGGLLVVYFGYTSCPDVCPTTMADLRRGLETLADEDAERVEVAMATVDPERDTDEAISDYVRSFVPGAHGLRTEDDDELRAAADAFGADYAVTTTPEGDVEVAHTGYLYVVDEHGRLRLQWAFGTTGDDIGADLSVLLDEVATPT